MHDGDAVLQVVEESQIKIQDICRLLGCEADPQQFGDHWLSHQKGNDVDQRENR